MPILVPEGTITSALTVYSYTLRETDTFFFIGQISHLFDQYDAEAIILPIATAQTAVLNANNCDVKITAPVQVSGGGFIASISGCRANLHVVLDGLLMEIENDGTVDMIASKYENVDACDERFSANGGLELNNGMNTPNDNKLTQPLSMHQMFGLYMFVAGSMTLIWVGWKVEKRYHFVEHNFNGFSFRERESDVLKSVEVGGGGGTGRDIGTGREPKGPGIEGEKRPGPEYPGIEKRPSPESEDGFESTEDAEKG